MFWSETKSQKSPRSQKSSTTSELSNSERLSILCRENQEVEKVRECLSIGFKSVWALAAKNRFSLFVLFIWGARSNFWRIVYKRTLENNLGGFFDGTGDDGDWFSNFSRDVRLVSRRFLKGGLSYKRIDGLKENAWKEFFFS